ncbi:oligosaccharide flippase family protein [Paenactinomyces guangxiensis]|uniref:Polysaccharide biosynthesis protein n=1 Tax=Paenactinomyces guangxiensis TaxID=1490290 RepID=A0A7W2AA41_9BACL|nr:polysaccharide biosynthesis protein [Paenactinomyces guangxiensis]MBA4495814.1 polysaccharide biosynthesis protein [Paenactinomyces guangxiensis]MBH8592904.1 polysaccharide biosynthesis protein [Paenactinomyces guangxiensis]
MAQMQQSFIKGAAILGLAAFLSKILGAVYRIPYQNITGNEGMYVYQQVYPLYSALLILATAGFPIAVSKLVSEKVAEGDSAGAVKVFRVASITLFLTGFFAFIILFFGAGQVAEWMGSRKLLTLPIQSVSFALLIVPVVSSIRGYFQGQQNMIPTAVSQIVEQMIRVTTILALSWYFIEMNYGFVYAGAGAVFGAFTGAAGSLIILLLFWRKNNQLMMPSPAPLKGQTLIKTSFFAKSESTKQIIVKILTLSLPICIGSLVLPLYSLVDSFTVANLLVENHWTTAAAIEAKGIYDRGQPLIQFAAFFATAISLSIVPAIAEAKAKGNEKEANERAALALRLTWMIGLPASVGLAVIALPANVMLFKDAAGSDALAILAFTTVFSTLGVTSAGILQGAGLVYVPARNLFIGVVVKCLLNLWLIPIWDIQGAAIATVVSYAAATLLNLVALRSVLADFLGNGGIIGKVFLAVGWMAVATYATMVTVQSLGSDYLSYRLAMTVTSLASVAVGALVYFWSLCRLGLLTRSDLEKVPKLRKKLLPFLDKWRLLRS